MWRSFFAALIGALVLKYTNPLGSNGSPVVFTVTSVSDWQWFEIVPFTFLGVAGVRLSHLHVELIWRRACLVRISAGRLRIGRGFGSGREFLAIPWPRWRVWHSPQPCWPFQTRSHGARPASLCYV